MRRNLGILAAVSAAAVAIGIYSQSGDVGVAEPEVAAPAAEQPPAPAPAPLAAAPAAPEATAHTAAEVGAEIARLTATLAEREAEVAALAADLAARDARLAERDTALADLGARLVERDAEIARLRADLEALRARFAFDVQLAAAKSGVPPGAPQVEAARADAADLDGILAFAKPSAAVAAAADAPMTAIHFETGSARITPGGHVHAAVAAAMLSEMPLARIRLVGFADRTGDPARNRRLAQRRAEAVAALLVAAGLPGDRIETRGEIDALPVATDAGVAEPLNRSVSIVAVPLPTT